MIHGGVDLGTYMYDIPGIYGWGLLRRCVGIYMYADWYVFLGGRWLWYKGTLTAANPRAVETL